MSETSGVPEVRKYRSDFRVGGPDLEVYNLARGFGLAFPDPGSLGQQVCNVTCRIGIAQSSGARMDAKNSADLFHNGEYDLAGATRRIAELEWALCVARRALDADAPDGAREAFRTIALDPTFALDHALDGAWRMGRLGDPHPCADSADPRSRKLAEVAAQETEGLLAGLIRRLRKAFSERMATPDT